MQRGSISPARNSAGALSGVLRRRIPQRPLTRARSASLSDGAGRGSRITYRPIREASGVIVVRGLMPASLILAGGCRVR